MKAHSDSKITKDTPFQGRACSGLLMIFVSVLLVVLCADESAQPVLNTGSLYQ